MTRKSPPPSPRIISMQGEVKPLKGWATVTYEGRIMPSTFRPLKRHVALSSWMTASGYRIIPVTIGPRS